MIAAAVLAGYALVIARWAPRLLMRSGVAERSPRLFVVLWQLACLSLLLSVVLAGLAAVFPPVTLHDGFEHLLSDCLSALRMQYESPVNATLAAVGVALLGYVFLRLALRGVPHLSRARAERLHHLDGVSLVGRAHREPDVTVIEHDNAAAYCVPGRNGRIVLTSTAISTLDDDELAAVLAHERAHMRGHHHLVLDLGAALAAAFPRVELFTHARIEVARLIEMLADDAAKRSVSGDAVATALVRLAAGPTPLVGLGVGGATSASRVRRMLAPARPLSRVLAVSAVVAGLVVLSAPLAIAAVPAVTAHHIDICD